MTEERIRRAADARRPSGVVHRLPVMVRAALPDEAAEVDRLTVAAYVDAGYFADARDGYLARMQNAAERMGQTDVWVAERAGRLVGAVTLAAAGNAWADIAEGGELEFRLLVVDPAAQRSGVAAALVEAIEAEAVRRGNTALVLTTNDDWEPAHRLYDALGFQREPERDWVPGDAPHVRLHVYRRPVRG